MSSCGKFATILRVKTFLILKLLHNTKIMWQEGMLWLTEMMGYNEYIPLLTRQMNDAEENLYPTIFYSTVIFCKSQHA